MKGVLKLKKIAFVLLSMLFSIFICNSNLDAANTTYYLNEVTLYNGTYTFHDAFSDGIEPPSGPFSSSDYSTIGTFGPTRESNGLLELNSLDGARFDDDWVIGIFISDNNYMLSSGSGGYMRAVYEANDGFWPNTDFAIGIENYVPSTSPNNVDDWLLQALDVTLSF